MYRFINAAQVAGLIILSLFGYSEMAFSEEIDDAIAAGKQEYRRSCALCHGDGGRGDGIYTPKLLVKPTNLTLLARDNSGVFPTRALFRIIEGSESIKVHGPRSMPVWGDHFDHESLLYVDARFTRTFVRGRIFELLLYLEQLQAE